MSAVGAVGLPGVRRLATAVGAVLAFGLSGCGLLALPCRAASAVIKIVPVIGHAAALPADACAAAIDP